ncbi:MULTISPECIES: ABC transporter permease [unclassified Devosia]|uniref:ABC transporter permease n=1 Tax=unclassified Devosia TaxID=196773 RepID=UPI00086F2536|nr:MULTISPECIES: ABC transporter permease [unclassified Devosia]MBN9362236.1 ABC transporter permease [Devosia sp.]ODS97229.1 MAG: mannose-1-phosphate guanyltransferase [Devosia sp. SCN 66-27]OJX24514.1 MAG: mannose-1-phosphate guanyltransferase [Devosia sp. 66-14]
MTLGFSLRRFGAVLYKEFIQMRRDRITFGMMIGLPIIQLFLFGFAINADPRNLPTLVEMGDNGPLSRAVIAGMQNSSYFAFKGAVSGVGEGEEALRRGTANFVVVIPADFERDVVRGNKPEILVAADASDPSATGGAVAALSGIVNVAIAETLTGPLAQQAGSAPFSMVVHREYNPEGKTSTNIVPGLLAIILSMTMVMITAVAIVKETERGTMEMLIATPVKPLEVMLGKILPYVFVGYVQTAVFLAAASLVFGVPFEGSVWAFFLGFNLFIVVNLALGFLISTAAKSQMQAMQLSFFTILPSILLSGFMFPFAGMPGWAQFIGQAVPATHFLRVVRKVMLKGGEVADVTGELWALLAILVVIAVIAMLRYRQTLD